MRKHRFITGVIAVLAGAVVLELIPGGTLTEKYGAVKTKAAEVYGTVKKTFAEDEEEAARKFLGMWEYYDSITAETRTVEILYSGEGFPDTYYPEMRFLCLFSVEEWGEVYTYTRNGEYDPENDRLVLHVESMHQRELYLSAENGFLAETAERYDDHDLGGTVTLYERLP